MSESVHACHANGCESPDLHPEVPFCKKHWSMLPKPHQDQLWDGRLKGECGVCDGKEADPDWMASANLGIALICFIEYGEHECPKDLVDEENFCWGCGVQSPNRTYKQAKAIVKKYRLKAR